MIAGAGALEAADAGALAARGDGEPRQPRLGTGFRGIFAIGDGRYAYSLLLLRHATGVTFEVRGEAATLGEAETAIARAIALFFGGHVDDFFDWQQLYVDEDAPPSLQVTALTEVGTHFQQNAVGESATPFP